VKAMLCFPLLLAVVAGIGSAICHAAGWSIHQRELFVAGAASLLAAEAALIPLLLTRGSDAGTVAQAGLGGTVAQMLLSIVLVGAIRLLGIQTEPYPLVWWLLVFYWVSLIAVVAAVIIAIREASRRRTATQPGADVKHE